MALIKIADCFVDKIIKSQSDQADAPQINAVVVIKANASIATGLEDGERIELIALPSMSTVDTGQTLSLYVQTIETVAPSTNKATQILTDASPTPPPTVIAPTA